MTSVCLQLALLLVFNAVSTEVSDGDRVVHSLNGTWQFQSEQVGSVWKTVTLPGSFEEHEGIEFDGVGTYKRTLPAFELPEGKRAILHFQAAATLADVSVNGAPVGSHLGGWTPFRFDVTKFLRGAPPATQHEVSVRLDEKVGHNSQGFLPIVAPHFGGIWQGVEMLIVSESWLDDLSLMAVGDPETGCLRVEMKLNGRPATDATRIQIRHRPLGRDNNWSPPRIYGVSDPAGQSSVADSQVAWRDKDSGVMSLSCPIESWQYWSPDSPNLYEVEVDLQRLIAGRHVSLDRVVTRAAFRTFQVDGPRLLLNGRPVLIHGLLNWGYAPPRVAPSVDEQHMRTEMEFARSCGFNLMKFCLWVPPHRYLELADELGMMTWIEYPTWHSQWTPEQLPTLQREFGEFFHFDRNHPSVVLRSLTCETGPSADLHVMRTLYDRCHAMIPGSVVEDDSSWIGWNRVHDFYDDHPYGNNHTWVATLDRLKKHIAERDQKPLVLGEAIAADTWVKNETLQEVVGNERPFWLPGFLEGNQQWLDRIQAITGTMDVDRLERDSKHFAFLMRKYQIEAYRREVPYGGYVVSVIRDFPLASMGLLDYLDRPKWPAAAWRWHGDTMLLLKTVADRRSFTSGEDLEAELLVSHFGNQSLENAVLSAVVRLDSGDVLAAETTAGLAVDSGDLKKLAALSVRLPEVSSPTRFLLRVELRADARLFENTWPMWVLPRSDLGAASGVQMHSSCSNELRRLFPDAREFDPARTQLTVVASRFDRPLIDFLESGGRVFLAPDGENGSLPQSNVWFLRGGPFVADHALTRRVPRELLVELQHFDLAGPVVPDMSYLEQVSPVLMFWDNHDLKRVKTHGLVFETRVGQGRLLVSALNHGSPNNSAGRWLLGLLLHHLETGAVPQQALAARTIQRMREKIDEDKIELVQRSWQFKPDADNVGLRQNWHLEDTPLDDTWKPIHIGTAWEGAGYPALDGWAWYRVSIQVPESWSDKPVYVSFEGVDDYYELYVNGRRAGSGGDIATKTTAFEDRTSHPVTNLVQAGETATIVVRVYDWYGAGGIFRPVSVGTASLGDGDTDVLQ